MKGDKEDSVHEAEAEQTEQLGQPSIPEEVGEPNEADPGSAEKGPVSASEEGKKAESEVNFNPERANSAPIESVLKMILFSGKHQCRNCNCKNSRCLKLYCECFAAGVYCSGCNCSNCKNNIENEKHRRTAISLTLERNPGAF